jgi:hypothetical protein
VQGTLRDFRVAEILQLVAVQQKTGLLRVQGSDETLTFYFDRGMLVSCRDRRRLGSDPLLDYLRRTGWLDPSMARQLESEVESSGDDLANLLLHRQIISSNELEHVLEDLAQDLITSSYGWSEGSYLFIAGDEALHGLNHRMSRNVEGLLMEAARRADEWPRLLEKVPGPETVVGGLQKVPSGLGAATRSILEKLQQPITMHELAAQARVPEFEVYETVAQAIETDMARVLERPRLAVAPSGARTVTMTANVANAPPAEPHRPQPIRRARALGAGTRRVLIWSVALLVTATCAVGSTRHAVQSLAVPTPTEIQVLAARAQLEHDLEVYRAVFGAYPATVAALIEADLTTPAHVEQAAIESFRVYDRGARYRIRYAHDES